MSSVWSFIRHKNAKDGGIFIVLFCSLKTNNVFYSHRKLVSKNASLFVAVLQWLHQLMQQNEIKYVSKTFFFLFTVFYKQYPYYCILDSFTHDIQTPMQDCRSLKQKSESSKGQSVFVPSSFFLIFIRNSCVKVLLLALIYLPYKIIINMCVKIVFFMTVCCTVV